MDAREGDKKQGKMIGLTVLLIFIGAVGGGWWWYDTTKYVTTDDARISGTIVNISSKVSGKLGQVLVAEGDIVKSGQVLARIDPQDIVAKKAEAEAALALAKANYDQTANGLRPQEIQQALSAVDQAKANLENASKNNKRMENLYADGAISAAQRDNAFASYQVASEAYKSANQGLDMARMGAREELVRAANAQVKQAEAALEAVNLMYGDTSIVSPVDGVVAVKAVNPGEMVVSGQSLFNIVNSNDLWVNARIEETAIGKLKIGQQVVYTIDSYPGRTFSGTIYDIGTAATSVFSLISTENTSNNFTKVTQRIPIKISIPKEEEVVFRPGMSVIIKVHLG